MKFQALIPSIVDGQRTIGEELWSIQEAGGKTGRKAKELSISGSQGRSDKAKSLFSVYNVYSLRLPVPERFRSGRYRKRLLPYKAHIVKAVKGFRFYP